ncbi:MAG: endonuclease [Thermoplasmatota archaeon]
MKNTPVHLYHIFISSYKSQHWWPMDISYHTQHRTDPRFEVIIGAILTQNTAWSNVEKAIHNLKQANMLHISAIVHCDLETLKQCIKPSGFFNQKAKRLQTMALYLQDQYQSDLSTFFQQPLKHLRSELLRLNGIGPETADSILLYAGDKPIFVVDAYSKRLFGRLELPTKLTYDAIQAYVESDFCKNISAEQLPQMYNEFHALIVEHAKRYCRKKPLCNDCILNKECPHPNTLE